MDASRTGRRALAGTLLPGTGALVFALGIVRSPDDAVKASLAGLDLWWKSVFPGLLPPLVLAELLAAFGALHALAVLCEPLFGRLFRLPGAAAWAVAVGWASGIPAGARETARLGAGGLIGAREAETALLLAHMPNLFLVVLVVGAGFLHSPRLGWAIAGGLWLSAILAGWLWSRIGGRSGPERTAGRPVPSRLSPGSAGTPLWRRCWQAMRKAREADGRPLGKILADSVADSVLLLFAVGGLMIMSAVAVSLIRQTLSGTDAWALIPGVVDMHLGAYENSRSLLLSASPDRMAALIAALLAWSGFSGLLQARAAYGTAAPFPWGAFIAGRLLHAALAFLCTYPLARHLAGANPAPPHDAWKATATAAQARAAESGWLMAGETTLALLGCLAAFAALALLAALIRPRPPSSAGKTDGSRPVSGGRADRTDG